MNARPCFALVCLMTLPAVSLPGCAAAGGRQINTTGRAAFGGLPRIEPGAVPVPQAQTDPLLRPLPIIIQSAPSHSPSRGQQWRIPESAATTRSPSRQNIPTVVPRPERGAPVAKGQLPASLSGGIEIIPGPVIRSQKPQLELLPPPGEPYHETSVESLPSPRPRGIFEALPAPE